MKILFINSVCNGSTGKIIQYLADDFEKNNNECVIAFGRGDPSPKFRTYKIEGEFSIKYHGLMNRLFDAQGLHSKKATKRLVKWIQEYNPDLVWLHNLHGYYIHCGILFAYLKKSQTKVRWTLHDCWAFTGHCAYFDFAKCSKWKTGCEKCPSTRDYPRSFYDGSKRNYQIKKRIFTSLPYNQLKIITPSKWLAKLVHESFLGQYDVEVINNKIDKTIFKPTKSKIKEKYDVADKKIILGVASVWDRRKGLDDFIKLSALIPSNYKIVLIGLSKKQILNLPISILGIGKTENQAELVQWYTAADVFLNLTYEDNYPTTNLEAQACGTICITYDTGGSVESVENENIVPKGDLDRVAKRIFQLTAFRE